MLAPVLWRCSITTQRSTPEANGPPRELLSCTFSAGGTGAEGHGQPSRLRDPSPPPPLVFFCDAPLKKLRSIHILFICFSDRPKQP